MSKPGLAALAACRLDRRSPVRYQREVAAAGGLLLACALGFATDMLSGALLGSHALLRMVAFCAARIGGGHFNLRAPLPQALFVAGFTIFNAAAVGAL